MATDDELAALRRRYEKACEHVTSKGAMRAFEQVARDAIAYAARLRAGQGEPVAWRFRHVPWVQWSLTDRDPTRIVAQYENGQMEPLCAPLPPPQQPDPEKQQGRENDGENVIGGRNRTTSGGIGQP